MRNKVLSSGYLQKLSTVVCLALGQLILANAVFIPEAHSEAIPSHLAKMAASLYKATADDLNRPGKDPKATEMRQRALKILRKTGIHHWARGSVSIDEDLKKNGARSAVIKTDDGDVVEFKWSPDSESFSIKIKANSDSDDSFPDITTLKGKVKTAAKKGEEDSGDDLVLDVEPEDEPIKTLTSEEFKGLAGNILGEWVEENSGDVYQFSAAEKRDGEIRPSREHFDKQIAQIKKKIKGIKSAKIFEWKNQDTGEIIKQEKFRRMKEPYEYIGEKFAQDNGERKIAELRKNISELEKERDGGNLPLVDKHDPAGFSKISSNKKARPVTVTVKRSDGYSYTYDEAVFDGRRISAKRTYRDIRDIENLKLPQAIRRMAIKDGWNPPGWLELDASIDADTHQMVLQGSKWALHVTYGTDGMFGSGNPVIHRIHTPFPTHVTLSKGGEVFKVAEGAKLRFLDQAGKEIIGELPYDQPVQVEVVFDDPQDTDQRRVRLSWSGDEDHWVKVKAVQGNKKVFRSEFMVFVPPEIDTEEGTEDGKLKL